MVLGAAFEGLGLALLLPILEGDSAPTQLSGLVNGLLDGLRLDPTLGTVLSLIVGFFVARTIFLVLQEAYTGRLRGLLLVNLRASLIEKLLVTKYEYFVGRGIGYLNNAMTMEYERVALAFRELSMVLVALIVASAYLALAFLVQPWLVVPLLGGAIPIFFAIRVVNRRTQRYSARRSAENATLQSLFIQFLNSFKYVRATFAHHGLLRKIGGSNQSLGNLMYREAVLGGISRHGFTPVIILIVAGILFYAVEVQGGKLVQSVFLLFVFKREADHIIGVQQHFRKFLVTSGSLHVFDALVTELDENTEEMVRTGARPDFTQPIVLEDVSFRYSDGTEALDAVNVVIPSKSTVAFVGASGSGKSTLVTLLTGLVAPTAGRILIGDLDLNDADQSLVRANIGYVTQESVIFTDTVRNNLTLWSKDGSDLAIREASVKANIADLIESFPLKYEAQLGDNGLNISGGQRQRISIARELYKNVELLIMDEATSALDTFSEQEIQKNIDRLKGEKTVVLVAHRLSTVKGADKIVVLREGRVVEQGSYSELYALEGEFRRMVDLQTIDYAGDIPVKPKQ